MLDINQTLVAWRGIVSDPELGPGYVVREARQIQKVLLHELTSKPSINCERICLGACHICLNHKILTDYLDTHAPWWGWGLRDWLDLLLEALERPDYPEKLRWEPGGYISSPLVASSLVISYGGSPALLWRPGCWIHLPDFTWRRDAVSESPSEETFLEECSRFDAFVMGQFMVDSRSSGSETLTRILQILDQRSE